MIPFYFNELIVFLALNPIEIIQLKDKSLLNSRYAIILSINNLLNKEREWH
jgi:hypothetical protein